MDLELYIFPFQVQKSTFHLFQDIFQIIYCDSNYLFIKIFKNQKSDDNLISNLPRSVLILNNQNKARE
jgi:hypothetical protein